MMNSELLSSGIEVPASLSKASSWDYDLLYLPDGDADGRLEPTLEADKKRAALPKRIVVGDVSESQPDGEKTYATAEQPLNVPESEEDILPVYDKWISFLLKRRKLEEISLSFFFEGLKVAAENWEKQIDLPEYVACFDPFAGNGNKAREKLDTSYTNGSFLWRHLGLSEVLKHGYKQLKQGIYYQECTYADSFFAYLSSVDPENQPFQAQYLIRQIVETTLSRVVIVDERVAQTVAAAQGLAQELAWMGIWIVGRVRFQDAGSPVPIQNSEDEKDDGVVVGTRPDEDNGLVTLMMNKREDKFITSIQKPEGLTEFPEVPEKIEIMTIHQTLLDGSLSGPLKQLLSDDKEWKESWVYEMKPQVLFTYFHSGRGHPRGLLPQNASFLEYSVLQTHILSQHSKFFFVQLALSSKEAR